MGGGAGDRPDPDGRWTRDEFLRRSAALGGGLLLFGGARRLLAGDVAFGAAPAVPAGAVHHYLSRPDLRPPVVTVLRADRTDDGLLFLAPSSGPGQRGLLILDGRGDVVFFHPTTPKTAMNFRAARYRGKPVLTWWEGKAESGLGRGTHVIMDSTYRELARVPAGDGLQSDLHEFVITPRSTALVTSYEVREANLSSVGGPAAGKVIGGVVQELALPSGRVLFEWRSLDHVPVEETHALFQGHPLDYFHVNSIDLAADGNLLVSARNTWAVYKVSRRSGAVIWRLGGRRSDFVMGRGTTFAWQHDARHHGSNRVTIFDDGAAPQVQPQSRVLVISLDFEQKRATTRSEVRPPPQPARLPVHGECSGAAERSRRRRVGQRAVRDGIRPGRDDPVRREAPSRRSELPGLPVRLGGESFHRPDARGSGRPARTDGVRELERGDRDRGLASSCR